MTRTELFNVTKIVGALFAVLILFGVLVTACGGKAQEPFKDAAVRNRNGSAADVLTMPDGFSNVAAKCEGPNRVYVIFKGDHTYGGIAAVKDDPRCKGS